jgi:hypothetical protein
MKKIKVFTANRGQAGCMKPSPTKGESFSIEEIFMEVETL